MEKISFIFNSDRCFGCLACIVACQQEHQLAPEQKFIDIRTVGPIAVNGKMSMRFVPHICVHCHAPLCTKACPVEAILKRDDGAVLVDSEKCTGCMECTWACPYQAIGFDDESRKAVKCDLCVGRVAKGLLPSCVHHCPARAIQFELAEKPLKPEQGKLTVCKGLVSVVATPFATG